MSSNITTNSATAAEPLSSEPLQKLTTSNKSSGNDDSSSGPHSSPSDQDQSDLPDPNDPEEAPHVYGWRFYAIFGGLIATTLLSALDGAIVATALPTIAATLDLGPNYVWVANIYWLTGYVIPLVWFLRLPYFAFISFCFIPLLRVFLCDAFMKFYISITLCYAI